MYNLLEGIKVLELSLLAPDGLGGLMADLGADVIKVEAPPHGGDIRWMGPLHFEWNRGKKSILVDLRSPQGRNIYLGLAAQSDIVIDGLRSGATERFGIAFDKVREVNPSVVYCTLNGFGSKGPYRDLATHGWAFDAASGISPPVIFDDGSPRISDEHTLVGIIAGSLYAAVGLLAALQRARVTGEAQHVEVAELNAALAFRAQALDSEINGIGGGYSAMSARVKYQYYRTKDDEYILFMAIEEKFWQNFCKAIARPDLGGLDESDTHERETMRSALTAVFLTRTRREWMDFFLEWNVAGAPAYRGSDVLDDPHVQAHDLIYAQTQADNSVLTLFGTPIRLPEVEEPFWASRPPDAGEHTREILSSVLGYDELAIDKLIDDGAVV